MVEQIKDDAQTVIEEAETRLGQPFKHVDELRTADTRLTAVNTALAAQMLDDTGEPETRGTPAHRPTADGSPAAATNGGPASTEPTSYDRTQARLHEIVGTDDTTTGHDPDTPALTPIRHQR